jgi:hypothetical protein
LRFDDGVRDRLGYDRREKHPTAGTHSPAKEGRERRGCWLGPNWASSNGPPGHQAEGNDLILFFLSSFLYLLVFKDISNKFF